MRDGDAWVINGQKTFITNGSIARTLVVSAVTDQGKGTKGISSFIVPTDTPGFQPGRNEDKLGLRASVTSQLFFNDCRVPAAQSAGPGGRRLQADAHHPGRRAHQHRRHGRWAWPRPPWTPA